MNPIPTSPTVARRLHPEEAKALLANKAAVSPQVEAVLLEVADGNNAAATQKRGYRRPPHLTGVDSPGRQASYGDTPSLNSNTNQLKRKVKYK